MRRALVTAVALAPLLAVLGAAAASAACPTAGATTSTAGNIDIASGCSVSPGKGGIGVGLNSNNTVTVEAGGSITNTDKDDSVGILVQGGNTGSVTNDGSINLSMSYAPATDANTGIVDGAFATGTGRIGISVIGPGDFTGSITNATGAAITVDGDHSFGISIETGVTGDVINDGTIAVLGNQTVGLNVAGAVGGNIAIAGTVSAQGVGAQGVVTSAPLGGQLSIGAAVSSTGYRSTTAPTNSTVLTDLRADQLFQGGSAVVIGGSVAGGVIVSPTITTGTGTSAVTTAAGSVTTFGSAPAMVIGAPSQAVVIGNNASDPYGLVVGGSVTAEGLYEQKTSPNLPAPAPATALVIGDGGTVNLTGGVHVTGSVAASSLDAAATAIEIQSGTTAGAIVNDNTISAQVSADESGSTALGIVISSGANVGSITNNGVLAASITASATNTSGEAGAIIDASGSLTAITNTGQITASLVPTDNSFVLTGPTVAIDVSHSTSGVAITQSPSTQFDGQPAPVFTGSISGQTLTVTGVTSGNLQVGETLYGTGIPAGVTIIAEGTGTGGKGTYTISATETVNSETLSAAGALPSITGDILFGAATAAAPNSLNIQAGNVTGAVSEVSTGTDNQGKLTTDRNLDITVNNATVDITKAELHQVTTLNVGGAGVLTAAIDPSFAIGASNPTPIFDTTVHSNQTGTDGTATFASGAQIGVRLDALQTAPSATYVFVQTSGAPGALTVGNLSQTTLQNAPFLYTAETSVSGPDLDVTVTLKTPAQLGLNASGSAAFDAVFNALEKDSRLADALIGPTTRAGFLTLYNQMLPEQSIGTFDALEAATEKIANLTEQTPDAGTRIAGTSAWLQEINTTVKEEDGAALGSTDKLFGLVAGYEKMGAGGGALGATLSYLNVQDAGTFEPIGGELVTQLLEAGAYYRRAWGGLRFSVRGAGGYAWFDDTRMFVTTGVSETSTGRWNGYFGDAHAGAQYEVKIGRFYLCPELSADYVYLNEAAHSETGAGPGFDLTVAQRVSDRLSGSVIMAFGAQYGHDAWFRPEIYGGYRQVFFGSIADTVANFTGGLPFSLSPGDTKGGWIVGGFSLKAGTPLSYVAIVGELDLRNTEQSYDIYLSGRTMF